MATGKKGAAQQIALAERRVKALALRKAGASYRAIGEQLGVSYQAIAEDVAYGLTALASELRIETEQLRALEAARLDDLQAALWSQVRTGNIKAIQTVLRIMERRARLLGLDMQPGMELPSDLAIILRWHDDRNIIDITPAANDYVAPAPQITESGSDAPGAIPYRVRWSEMGQEPIGSDAEPENGA